MKLGTTLRPLFPLLDQSPRLAYLDSAATSLKPRSVIDGMSRSLGENYATVHRGIYTIARQATDHYEKVRQELATWIGAERPEQVIFTRGTTDSINMLAMGLSTFVKPGDEIVLSEIEHHSNLVPWQMLASRTGATLCFAKADTLGRIDENALIGLITKRTRIVSLAHMPNTTGRLHDFSKVFEYAHSMGALCILDGGQAVTSVRVDVKKLGCNFYVFSAHKIYGPTGLGFLWGDDDALEQLTPRDGGGEMVDQVMLEKSSYAPLPLRLEAGTPPIAEVLTMSCALEFLNSFDMQEVLQHKLQLAHRAQQLLEAIPGTRVFADPGASSVVLFTVDGVHPLDLTTLLDSYRVALRSGQMCAQPALRRLGLESALRISFGVYSDIEDLEQLDDGLRRSLARLR